MAILSRLDVVNDMLAGLGELPVNALDEGHPMVPTAIRVLDIANAREQTKGWWFNRELTDLVPDTDGFIYLPNDTLKVAPQSRTVNVVQRGRRLYKPYDTSASNKYVFDKTMRMWLVREVPFDDLPASASMFISYSSQIDFMKSYEADPQKFQQLMLLYKDSLITLTSEHTRAIRANMLARRPVYNELTDVGGTMVEADYWPHP